MQPTRQADENDILYAYRLLLGREPDAAGLAHHRSVISHERISAEELARTFIASREFAERNQDAPVEVVVGEFAVFVRPEDQDVGRAIRTNGQYEPHVTAAIREILKARGTFVDVGANIGFFTQLAASIVGREGHVFAIEPMDKNVQLIYRSLVRNGFDHVEVHACAASDRVGLVSIATGPRTSNAQIVDASRAQGASLLTQAKRLDDLTSHLTRVDLVKFDIEGYELLAWRGFRAGLAEHRPIVLTEFHPYCMRTYVGVDPQEYLDELFAYAGSLHVLAFSGDRIECRTPEEVMLQWEAADKAARADGTCHLDLLIRP